MRAWHVLHGDIREDVSISQEIVEFIQDHGALSVRSGHGQESGGADHPVPQGPGGRR
jgi:hypothetical protein